jgi:chromate transporter
MLRFDRRQLLKALGMTALASAVPHASRARAEVGAPSRIVFFVQPHGHVPNAWTMPIPQGSTELLAQRSLLGLSREDFSEVLRPLFSFRDRLLVVEGLSHLSVLADLSLIRKEGGDDNNHTLSFAGLLTADRALQRPNMQCTGGGRSLDQEIARRTGAPGRYASRVYGDHSIASFSYLEPGQPTPLVSEPATAFADLTSAVRPPVPQGPLSRQDRLRALRGSVLDAVAEEYGALAPKLGRADRQKLDAHRDLVRELELSLSAGASAECALEFDATGDRVTPFMRLIRMALACDLTRVVTYVAPVPRALAVGPGAQHAPRQRAPTRAPSCMPAPPTSLRELAFLFLRLGATAFGGPAAHIAMMRDEVVRRRGWLSDERFLDLLGATNLIPGPNSTEMAIHVGWERRRWAGLLTAGVCFIVPASLITAACGWAYVRFGSLPTAGWLLYGVKPVIVAVVLQAIFGLTPSAAKTPALRVLGVIAAGLAMFSVHELLVLLGAGAASALLRRTTKDTRDPGSVERLQLAGPLLAAGAGGLTAQVTLPSLFWVFFKAGSVLFGSGYVLVAFLRNDLVHRLGWLSESQLIDAIAVGQVTPGPVFTTATFIGYVLAGPLGAVTATFAIFVPAFVFVAVSSPLVRRIRASPVASSFLDGVNVASLALMVVVTAQLARAAVVDAPTAALAVGSAFLLLRYGLNSTWLIALGASVGLAAHALGVASP